jgi:hypothetical protein
MPLHVTAPVPRDMRLGSHLPHDAESQGDFMRLRRVLALVVLGAGLWAGGYAGEPALAAPAPKGETDGLMPRSARSDFIEAQQFRLADGRIASAPGQPSSRQTVTAWQVSRGMWNGQPLDGLSLVLVQTVAEDGNSRPLMNCYISHLATAAQRRALVSAYAASNPRPTSAATGGLEGDTVRPLETSSWRIEPAVIRIESDGGRVVVHLGTIA